MKKKFNILSLLFLHVPLNFWNEIYTVFPTKILILNIYSVSHTRIQWLIFLTTVNGNRNWYLTQRQLEIVVQCPVKWIQIEPWALTRLLHTDDNWLILSVLLSCRVWMRNLSEELDDNRVGRKAEKHTEKAVSRVTIMTEYYSREQWLFLFRKYYDQMSRTKAIFRELVMIFCGGSLSY